MPQPGITAFDYLHCNLTAGASGPGTTTLSFNTSCTTGSSDWVVWEVRDANGVPVPGAYFENDDCAHADHGFMNASFTVPAGVGYQMYGEFSDYDGNIADSAFRVPNVSPAEAAPGATIVWMFH